MIRTCTIRLFGLALGLMLSAFPATAQEAAAEGTTEVVSTDPAELLLDKIKKTDVELNEVIRDLPDARGEDQIILRSRFDKMAAKMATELKTLTDLISDRRKAGADTSLLEGQEEQLLKRSSRRLRSYIRIFQDDLRDAGLERDTLSVADAQVFEHQMAVETDRLDRLYMSLIRLGDEMVATGLPVDSENEFLESRLTERGQSLFEMLELSQTQLIEYQGLLKRAPDDHDLQAQNFATEERYDSSKTSLMATIHMMKTLSMDYEDLEVRTLELTREITPEALEIEVALGLFRHGLTRLKTYLIENGPKMLVRLVVVIGILLLFWSLAKLSRRGMAKVLARTTVSESELLKKMIVSMTGRLVLLVGVIIVLSQLGINLGPLLAGLGIAGFIVGFALQDTLSNFAAGAMILAYRPFDVGDLVEAAGVTGKVRALNLVSTHILTVDHQTLIVPNRRIWGDVIRNVTAQPRRRIDMVFGISYEDEIPRAEQVLQEIVARHDKVLDDPEPVVKVHTLNDSSVDFVVRPWAKTDDYWDVYWDITREVKMRFDKEGISIPYPQRDVHLIGK